MCKFSGRNMLKWELCKKDKYVTFQDMILFIPKVREFVLFAEIASQGILSWNFTHIYITSLYTCKKIRIFWNQKIWILIFFLKRPPWRPRANRPFSIHQGYINLVCMYNVVLNLMSGTMYLNLCFDDWWWHYSGVWWSACIL